MNCSVQSSEKGEVSPCLCAEAVPDALMSRHWRDERSIARHLYTNGLPELDLVIRTSGEMRLSNFLLWQVAYAEIYVTETLWPDFRGTQLLEAIEAFQKRERRFGGLTTDNGNLP